MQSVWLVAAAPDDACSLVLSTECQQRTRQWLTRSRLLPRHLVQGNGDTQPFFLRAMCLDGTEVSFTPALLPTSFKFIDMGQQHPLQTVVDNAKLRY